MVDEEERAASRRARWRAIREAVGLVVIVIFTAAVYLLPLAAVLMREVPQLSVLLPEPARTVTIAMGGLPAPDEVLSEGAEGEADDGDVADAPEAPPPPAPSPTTPAPPLAPTREDGTPAPEPAPTTPEPRPDAAKPDDAVAEAAPTPPPDPDQAVAEATARKKGRKGNCGEPHPDIVQVEPGHWHIQRSLVDYYGSSVERFNSLGYSRHYEDDHGTKGWQVGGFGCQSPLWKAGLRSKDVLQTVNGKKTNNVVQLFGIWLGQRNKDEFVIELLRHDRPVTLRYTLVGVEKRRRG